ncbi:MAG: hypothetical protein H6773_03755 [Pseudomonadales bacterium]|nr:hypothetical protein [Pseudomonadales bacterium]
MSTDTPLKKPHTSDLEKELKALDKQLQVLNERMRKANSVRYRFFMAVIQGFGVALGGTIVAYIIITILVETLRQINYIPIINMIFDSEYFSIFVDRLLHLQTELQ